MSERQRKLTITERFILTFIGYKTKGDFKFFMNNEKLAKAICCTTSSTKVMVNKLVREGYLIKNCDIRAEDNYRSPDANLRP
jgi:DNA-binding MarR family transcriptional regulator